MNKERIIRLLEDQLRFANEQIRELTKHSKAQSELLLEQSKRLSEQSEEIEKLNALVKEQTVSFQSLEEMLQSKDIIIQKEKEGKRALGKLLKTKSEKQTPAPAGKQEEPQWVKPAAIRKGNNNARRKEFVDLEVEEVDVYPDSPEFDKLNAKYLKTVDSIRYIAIPPRFIKRIYHIHSYKQQQKILSGKAPITPFLNSNYDSSLLAYILQLRYIYSLPIERILKLMAEYGFKMNKSTVHGLIAKAAGLFESLETPLKEAILEDQYVHMDETYYTVLDPSSEKEQSCKSRKVYIWSILAHNRNLIQFFYDDGSRARKVLTDYLPENYKGVVQSDGFVAYQILETEDYHDVYRLPCLQHCKRKFIDIKNNNQAQKVVDTMNELYQVEHRKPPELSNQQSLAYRIKHMKPVLDELKSILIKIQNRKDTLPKSKISKAVNYTLGEFKALTNILLFADCELDNNAIERNNRYISLSRRNSLFFATHQGAKNGTLIYSLACSCRLNGINTFEYFSEVLNKLPFVHPGTDKEILRSLLPDRYEKRG